MSTSRTTVRNAVRSPRFATTDEGLRKLGLAALAWIVVFTAFHVYWWLGGTFGFGDAESTVPEVNTAAGWAYTVVIGGMFAVGVAVSLAIFQPWGRSVPTWMIQLCLWSGGLLLTLRGLSALLDTALRQTGALENGLTGLTYEQVTGSANPTAYTLWSSSAIDLYFFLGGVVFVLAALAHRHAVRTPR